MRYPWKSLICMHNFVSFTHFYKWYSPTIISDSHDNDLQCGCTYSSSCEKYGTCCWDYGFDIENMTENNKKLEEYKEEEENDDDLLAS